MVTRWFTVKRSSFTIIKHESFARDISAIRLLEVSIVSEPLNFRYAVLVAVHGALVLFGCGSAALCLCGFRCSFPILNKPSEVRFSNLGFVDRSERK